jgi:hypothetical protein
MKLEKYTKKITHILKTVIEQNYFQFDQEYYKETHGLAMGAPTSSVLAETVIQHIEHTQIYPILVKQQIIEYFRYADDILIIYDQNKTNTDHTLKEFNKLRQTIKFTIKKEQQESIYFLAFLIHRNEKSFEISIHRKPTQTDISNTYAFSNRKIKRCR